MHLATRWETEEKFGRKYYITDEEGNVLEEFGDYPTLDQLRQAEKRHGERIDLRDIGAPCANCSTEIRGRFAADPRGNLLCWDCAVSKNTVKKEAGVRVNTDSSQVTYSQSQLYEKSLCDYVINVATGCRHGCKFCYVPTTPGYEVRDKMLSTHANVNNMQQEWGSYLLYRDDLPERLHEKLESEKLDSWQRTERGRGIVMLSSGTDPYQDRRAAQISRSVIYELCSCSIPVRVLTRSSIAVKDVELFSRFSDLVTVGSSIPSLKQNIVNTIEPGAPPPLTRWQMLDMIRTEVSIFVSMSPTYPTMDEHELHRLLTRFKSISPEVIFHEPINPRGSNFDMMVEALEEEGLKQEAQKFRQLKQPREWIEYALKHINRVQKKARELDTPIIHSWPDRELMRATSGTLRDQLAAMRQSISPESFRGRSTPDPDSAQSPLFEEYSDVQNLIDPSKLD